MTVLILIPQLILGVVLLIFGLRGKRIGDHPVCRGCGFDLFGLPRDQARCPECGQVLLNGGVHIGHKKRKSLLIGIGLMMLLLSIGGVVLIIGQLDFENYKPVWWLKREAMVMLTRNAAVDELIRRLKNSNLTQAEIDGVADEALGEQADLKKTWLPQWGDFVETAHSMNSLDAARWKRYAGQALQPPQITLRKKVRAGDPLVVGTSSIPGRVSSSYGSQGLMYETIKTNVTGDLLSGKNSTGGGGGTLTNGGGGMSWGSVPVDPKKLKAATPGFHHVGMSMDLQVKQSWESKEVLATRHFDLVGDFELLPADAHPVKEIHDDALKEKIAAALTAKDFQLQQNDNYRIKIDAKSVPAPLAVDVIIKSGDKTWKLSGIHFAKGATTGWGTGGMMEGFTADKADVILRSSLDAATNSMDLYEMWIGEIVIKNVPVKRPSTQPVKK